MKEKNIIGQKILKVKEKQTSTLAHIFIFIFKNKKKLFLKRGGLGEIHKR